MILFPAVDLKEGRCVRLIHGDMNQATIFNDDPAAQARAFEAQGFTYLHVVDLDGAFAGKPVNAQAVRSILRDVSMPVQLGGGIRSMADIERWLAAGVRRVILGSAAVEQPELIIQAARAYPGRIVVGIDARDGMVATQGWAEEMDLSAMDLARQVEQAGVAAIIYTDIGRDGMMTGLNLDQTLALAGAVAVPVIASGGVGQLADIVALCARAAGAPGTIEGVIVGRALYDGRVDPAAALAALC